MKLLLLFWCTFISHDPFDGQRSGEPFVSLIKAAEHQVAQKETSANDRWANLFNTNIQHIDSAYVPNAILLSADGIAHDTPKTQKRQASAFS